MKNQKFILIIVVLAQFMCTSLWFAGNAVIPDLISLLNLEASDLGYITSSVQFGFIIGTLVYAFFTIADRFNPSKVFFFSSLLAAIVNCLIVIDGISFTQLLFFRFLTGFFLAGIYPVGMKIASDYFEKGLGMAMSYLVGALVVGTALPHLIASFDTSLSWKSVIYLTSSLAMTGGLLIVILVGVGPYRKVGSKLKFKELIHVFSNSDFRFASIGYFGHMWELYAFWAFVPMIISTYSGLNTVELNTSFLSFIIIAMGGIACVMGGALSNRFGLKRVANYSLSFSGLCCLIIPFVFQLSPILFLTFLIFWGMVVIADSPLFSSLVAQNAIPELKGTALTLVTSIGFLTTILSIQLLTLLTDNFSYPYVYMMLGIGPIVALLSQGRKKLISLSS